MPTRFEELIEEAVARLRARLERGEIYALHGRLHASGGLDPVPLPPPGGGGGGHVIQDDGMSLPERPALNFGQGLVASDNAQAGRTDVNLEYGGVGDVAPVDAAAGGAGALLRVPRADHKHQAAVAAPVDLADANAEGVSTSLARSDHVHRRSVRVKTGGGNYIRNALGVTGLAVSDDPQNDEVDIVHDSASPGHHAQLHDDADHTGPSRVRVQDEGITVGERATLNFTGAGVTVVDDAPNSRVTITIPGGGSGGHTIKENGAALPQRSGLNFADGLVASDDSAGDETDVSLDYAGAADLAAVDAGGASAGTSVRAPRADHKHHVTVAGPVDLGDATAEGSAATLARSDHVHKRSVRVKGGTSDLARNALRVTGLSVGDNAIDDEIEITHSEGSAGHHPRAHDDADHTGPSRVQVQDEGAAVAARATLNFVGTGVTVTDDAANSRVNVNVPGSATIQLVIDGGGAAITTGVKAYVEVPFDCTVTGWTVVADQAGSIQIDVWRSTYAAFPPQSAGSIVGTEKPQLSSQQKNQDLALTTWTTALSRGDWLAFNVDSASTVTLVTLSLRVERR